MWYSTNYLCKNEFFYYFYNNFIRRKHHFSPYILRLRSIWLGMAILPRPAPPHPTQVFPAPQRWWGGDGAIFCPCTPRRGGDGFSIFIPASPRPCPILIRTIIVNLVNPKSLIFKVKHKTLDKIFFILNLLLLPLTLLPSL